MILIDGGCWTKVTVGRDQVDALGGELRNRGVVVWSIGYRRVDEAGGAYPGIFQDVAKATDLLPPTRRSTGRTFRVVAVVIGRRAPALWAASRGRLPRGASPLDVPDRFHRQRDRSRGVATRARRTGIYRWCAGGRSSRPDRSRAPEGLMPILRYTSRRRCCRRRARIVIMTGADDSIDARRPTCGRMSTR